MDELASSLLAALKKSSASTDSKLDLFNRLKSAIKHQNIPESAQPATFECIRLAIASQTSSSLVAAGLSTFVHLHRRLKCQGSLEILNVHVAKFIPIFLDRLGDLRENTRIAASQCFCDLWSSRPVEVERAIRESALTGSNVRAKEAGIQWISKMHKEHGLQFRSFVPPLVDCLEDPEGVVRDTAKSNIIELFSTAPDRAKADLKKQLVAHSVRYSIISYIQTQLAIPGPADTDQKSSTNSGIRTDKPKSSAASSAAFDEGDIQLPPSQTVDRIEPSYVHTMRELEDEFRDMQASFEGKETEQNWMARDKNILKLRRLNQGNAPTDHPVAFVAGIKNLTDGILKVANSLRTTMSTNGCHLIQELARSLGSAMDSMVEVILQSLIKMCSATKHISAQNSNSTVEIILSNVSYNVRLMQHVWSACQDKNVQPRSFASAWLKILIKRHGHNRSHLEHAGGLDIVEKIIKKGLSDPNPKVREGMRGTYWEFARIWPEKGESIISSLDAKSRQLLEKDPGNPTAPITAFTSSVGPVNPRAARTALQEQIAAQRRAAARQLPDRPNSAQSTFSPVRQSATPNSRAATTTSTATNSTKSSSSITGQGSLMSAPMRRPKRPDLPRPATADPYANRKFPKPEGTQRTPVISPEKLMVTKQAPSHTKAKSTTSISTSKAGSPRPPRFGSPFADFGKISSIQELSMAGDNPEPTTKAAALDQTENEQPVFGGSSVPIVGEDENFTLVLPSRAGLETVSTELQAMESPTLHDAPINGDFRIPRDEDAVMVYEDPGEPVNSASEDLEKPVLEELPLNEQNLTSLLRDESVEPPAFEQRITSPTKGNPSRKNEDVAQDRAEILRSRRLLASGVERIRAKTLDAHGFRRLQDLVKNNRQDGSLDFTGLFVALSDYLQAPIEGIQNKSMNAQNLKTQTLSTIRAVLFTRRRDEKILKEYPRALCAVLLAKQDFEGTAHITAELERTADEILLSSNQPETLLDAVIGLAERESGIKAANHRRTITMALSVLSKLLVQIRNGGIVLSEVRKQRVGRLAVKFLSDMDADVRRADTELCLDLHDVLEGSRNEQSGGEFWRYMRGAKEQHLNLIAYYLARRESMRS